MKKHNLRKLDKEDKVQKIAHLTFQLWQVHPFSKGNTKTISVFIGKYWRKLGYNDCLIKFFEKWMYNENNIWDIRDTVVKEAFIYRKEVLYLVWVDMRTLGMDKDELEYFMSLVLEGF